MTTIMYAGTISETGAQMRPMPALSLANDSPVVLAKVIAGMPIDPNATGAVFASRQIAAA
jgi:hypothetical protein